MRKRYITLPRARYSDDLDCQTIDVSNAMTVFELDDTPVHTGLLDKNGEPIMAVYGIDQIGFIRREEEDDES